MILKTIALIVIFFALISSIEPAFLVIYNEHQDQAPVNTYSTAGSTQLVPLAKKLISPSCPVKYKIFVIHWVANKPVLH